MTKFLAVWPSVIAMILISWKLTSFAGSGSLFGLYQSMASNCDHGGFGSVLAGIGNFALTPKDYCFIHTWVPTVELQICLILPFIIYLLAQKKDTGF